LSRGERRVIDPHFQALGTAGQSGSLNGGTHGRPIGRPSSGGRKFFIEIFENRESFPDANVAIFKGRDLARERDQRNSLEMGSLSDTRWSSNARPATLMAIHGRSDHGE
jgi:hypothetical protein